MKKLIEEALAGGDHSGIGDELPYKLQMAAAAILVYAAKADGTFSEDELDTVMRALAKEFKHADTYTAEMIDVALYLYDSKKRLSDFTTLLNQSLAQDQKEHLFALVSKVIRSDGRVSVAETILAGELAKSFGLVA